MLMFLPEALMNKEGLLAEVEDLLRTSPPQSAFEERENDEALSWLGRTKAVLTEWDLTQSVYISSYSSGLQAEGISQSLNPIGSAYRGIRTLLFQAQHDLRMKTLGPRTVAIPEGMPFDYFNEIRKITEMAREDLLFVDPYLDAEFVSRYLRPITSGVVARLLTSKKLASLLPAVETLVTQTGLRVECAPLHPVFMIAMSLWMKRDAISRGHRSRMERCNPIRQ